MRSISTVVLLVCPRCSKQFPAVVPPGCEHLLIEECPECHVVTFFSASVPLEAGVLHKLSSAYDAEHPTPEPRRRPVTSWLSEKLAWWAAYTASLLLVLSLFMQEMAGTARWPFTALVAIVLVVSVAGLYLRVLSPRAP